MVTVQFSGAREFEIAGASHVFAQNKAEDVCIDWEELEPEIAQELEAVEQQVLKLGARVAEVLLKIKSR